MAYRDLLSFPGTRMHRCFPRTSSLERSAFQSLMSFNKRTWGLCIMPTRILQGWSEQTPEQRHHLTEMALSSLATLGRQAGVPITDLRNRIHFDQKISTFTSQTVGREQCNALARLPAIQSVRTLWASLMGSFQLQRSTTAHYLTPIAYSEGIVASWKAPALKRKLRYLPTIRQLSHQKRRYGLAVTLNLSSMDMTPLQSLVNAGHSLSS